MKKAIATLLILAFSGPALANGKTPTEETRAVVEALFVSFNKHDVEEMMGLYHADVVKMTPESPNPEPGYEFLKGNYAGLFQALPNVYDDVTRLVVEGENAAVEFTATWDNPDGTQGRLKIAAFLKVKDGLIVEDFTYYDTAVLQSE